MATRWRSVWGGGVVPDSCEYLVIEEHQGTEWNQTSEHKSADVNVEPKPNTLMKFKSYSLLKSPRVKNYFCLKAFADFKSLAKIFW